MLRSSKRWMLTKQIESGNSIRKHDSVTKQIDFYVLLGLRWSKDPSKTITLSKKIYKFLEFLKLCYDFGLDFTHRDQLRLSSSLFENFLFWTALMYIGYNKNIFFIFQLISKNFKMPQTKNNWDDFSFFAFFVYFLPTVSEPFWWIFPWNRAG